MATTPEEILSHRVTLFKLCMKLTRNYTNAQDLCQETLCKAIKHMHTFTEGRVIAWLFVIARNHHYAANRLKSSKQEPLDLDLYSKTAGREPTQELTVRLQNAMTAMAKLPAIHQRILQHAMSELSHEEIAAIENIHPGTVKSRLNRARKAMRDLCDEAHTDR